jgi:serine/threonine protein kinase
MTKFKKLGFSMERSLGGGAYSDVFLARGAKEKVVIKLPRESVRRSEEHEAGRFFAQGCVFPIGGVSYRDPDPREIIEAEARCLGHIRHPAMVKLIASPAQTGSCCLVLEYIDGPTWREALASKNPPTMKHVCELVEAWQTMNKNGQLASHGDIKPDNLILQDGQKVRIIDPSSGFILIGKYDFVVRMLLTPLYNPLFKRSDISALGILIMEVGTGKQPFVLATPDRPKRRIGQRLEQALGGAVATGYARIWGRVVHMPLPRELRPDFPERLEALALRCLGLKRDDDSLEWCEPLTDLRELVSELRYFSDLRPFNH